MQTIAIEGPVRDQVTEALSRCPLFASLAKEHLAQVSARATLHQYEPREIVVRAGDPSDSFFVMLSGEASVLVGDGEDPPEVATLKGPDSLGEMGLLLDTPRTATVRAKTRAALLRFDSAAFHLMYERISGFGIVISRALAKRLQASSRQLPMPAHASSSQPPDPDVLAMLPVEFRQRHRVVPIKVEGATLFLGFVDDPNATVLNFARQLLPAMELHPVRIDAAFYDRVMRNDAGLDEWSSKVSSKISSETSAPSAAAPASPSPPARPARQSPQLDALLRRMVNEGASDLHLSAGQVPRWRVDGDIEVLTGHQPLGADEVYALVSPIMVGQNLDEFTEGSDTDFAYAIEGVARFRVNLFRDRGGVGAVFRQIPTRIATLEQLHMPAVIETLSDQPKGLVLVTGPTGSGKSTTLAAMIDRINKTRKSHIITLEDPIEFVHQSQAALVNQREVGRHTQSFSRALRAALREDPDIVLVGEMRDLETVSLALETANTGHLVFGTLHTATAVSTIDRIIDLFPSGQQNQVRTVLADTLKGVVAQTLCKRVGGGRIAALEILVSNTAVSNLIREGKNFQIPSIMTTQKALGNQMLNESLAALVGQGLVDYPEALRAALDKSDLARRCNQPPPTL